MTLHVGLLMPDRSLWSGEASMVIAKTIDGDVGILTGRAPVFGILSPGSMVRIQPLAVDEEGSGTEVQAALALAGRITGNAPLAVQASKRVAYGAVDGTVGAEETKWAQLQRETISVLRSEDAKEGPRAFAEKRQPVWKAR